MQKKNLKRQLHEQATTRDNLNMHRFQQTLNSDRSHY